MFILLYEICAGSTIFYLKSNNSGDTLENSITTLYNNLITQLSDVNKIVITNTL